MECSKPSLPLPPAKAAALASIIDSGSWKKNTFTPADSSLQPFKLFESLILTDVQEFLYQQLLIKHPLLKKRDYLFFIIWIKEYIIDLDHHQPCGGLVEKELVYFRGLPAPLQFLRPVDLKRLHHELHDLNSKILFYEAILKLNTVVNLTDLSAKQQKRILDCVDANATAASILKSASNNNTPTPPLAAPTFSS